MLLYRILISGYFWAIRLAALFSEKAKKWVQGRKAIQPYVTSRIHGEKVIWMHCSSLGEFEQGRPVLERIREDFPEEKLLLTFFSPSGYDVRKNYAGVDYVCFLPEDRPRAIQAFLTQVDPKMVIFVKYDYWFLLLKALLERKVPIYFVSAVVKKGHFLMKWYSVPFRKILRQVNHFFVQDEFSAKQFDAMGIRQVTVVGDTRVDRVASLAQNVPAFPIIQEWVKGHRVFICGSTWANDEEIIVPAFRQLLDENWKIIIAPHDVSPKNVSRLRKILPASHEVFSSLSIDNQSDRTKLAPANILVVDTIGQLNMLYQYGTLCYIGGGFNKSGIHNTLEPATFGLPLIFGPNYSKFAEARALVKEGGAYSIGLWQRKKQVLSLAECRDQLEEVLRKMKEKESLEKARKVTKSYIEKNQGATTKILEKIYSAL